jgi:signal transduction histidine kinase
LGLDKSIRCGIGILEDFEGMQTWSATLDDNGEYDLRKGMLNMTIHPLLKGVKSWWKKGKSGFKYTLIGNDVLKYYDSLNKEPEYPFNANLDTLPDKVFHNSFVFTEGILFSFTSNPLSEEAISILKRFTAVFEQTYTRFLDLQKAETQAREAQIEASLERVRSRTMAMQNSEELAETSVVVFKQLLELGISPNRLFIGIINDGGKIVEAWATNEDGSKVENRFTLQVSKNKFIKKMVDGWRQQKKSIVFTQQGKDLQEYFKYLSVEMKVPFKDGLKQKRRVQTIAYFSGGMIGMAASEEQPKETSELLERFAAVFNLTYTRFNDLKLAEANTKKAEQDLINLQVAKKSAEEALIELKATQSQLIQSEKMASLGELTAGIAHEIQNPLNFVNNFSELSEELLDELKDEIKGKPNENIAEILSDLKQNLNKINNHGKRASNIVKGMLDHSRTSSGIKELVDINLLADEYLRLSYHGLRAKDKSFNALFKTDLDQSLPKIEIVAQDFGRVILNLINNAFYAVNKKGKESTKEYQPTVTLSTKKKANTVEIMVKDNGDGIPKHIKEKIFQPFFTTKPTGEGTGLGLSLAYDIITKGHGGELKVNSIEGEGTQFKIVLPFKS